MQVQLGTTIFGSRLAELARLCEPPRKSTTRGIARAQESSGQESDTFCHLPGLRTRDALAPETAFALVQRELVQRLPGAPWKGTTDGN